MEITCQRCNETLREADRYCSVCGLPQLMYLAAEVAVIPLGSEAGEGPTPEAALGSLGLVGGDVAWRPALRAAILLAIPAGLLISSLTPILGVVWIMGAAAWAVVLYARRARIGGLTGNLSIGTGARIGLVTGVLASWLTCGVNGVGFWVARAWLHQGGQMDSLWESTVEKSFEQQQQMIVQTGMAAAQTAEFAQIVGSMRALMLSPEGRAGFALLGLLMITGFLLVFATIGGAVGAKFLASPRRPGA